MNATLLRSPLAGYRVGLAVFAALSPASQDRQLHSSLFSNALPTIIHPLPASSSHFPLSSFLHFTFSFYALSCSSFFFFLFTYSSTYMGLYLSLPTAFPKISYNILASQNTTSYCSCKNGNNSISTPPCLASIIQWQLTCILVQTALPVLGCKRSWW